MRFKEFISESVKKAEVNWQQWKAAMAASAVQRNVPRGIDAIVYLGIIGDPSSNTGLGVKFKRTAQIGMDVSAKGQGYIQPGAQAEYNPNDFTIHGPQNSSRDQVGQDFDILFDFQGEPLERQNWSQFQDALSNTLAHELMHRGLAIIDRLPAIKANIPNPSRTYFEQRFSNNIPGLYNADQLDPKRDFFPTSNSPGNAYLEHMMIYSMFSEQSYLSRPENVEYAAQVQKFRKIYMDIEGAAQKYVLSYPIPPGSLAALRSELDGKTPDNVKVEVPIVNNKPTVTITKIDDAVKKGAKAVSDVASKGANAVSNVSDILSKGTKSASDILSKGTKSASDILSKGATAVGDVTDTVSKGAKSASDTVSKGAKTVGDKLAVGYKDLLDKISSKKDLKADLKPRTLFSLSVGLF